MMVLQNHLDSQKDVPGSHSEACLSSPQDGVQAVNIKVEEFSDIEDGEDLVPMTVVGIKAEHVVSCMLPLCPLLGISESHPELPVLFLVCICHTNLLSVPFDMSQEDCFLLHIAHGILLPFCVNATYMKQSISVILVSHFVTRSMVQYEQ
jgi:hypothetical protein